MGRNIVLRDALGRAFGITLERSHDKADRLLGSGLSHADQLTGKVLTELSGNLFAQSSEHARRQRLEAQVGQLFTLHERLFDLLFGPIVNESVEEFDESIDRQLDQLLLKGGLRKNALVLKARHDFFFQ